MCHGAVLQVGTQQGTGGAAWCHRAVSSPQVGTQQGTVRVELVPQGSRYPQQGTGGDVSYCHRASSPPRRAPSRARGWASGAKSTAWGLCKLRVPGAPWAELTQPYINHTAFPWHGSAWHGLARLGTAPWGAGVGGEGRALPSGAQQPEEQQPKRLVPAQQLPSVPPRLCLTPPAPASSCCLPQPAPSATEVPPAECPGPFPSLGEAGVGSPPSLLAVGRGRQGVGWGCGGVLAPGCCWLHPLGAREQGGDPDRARGMGEPAPSCDEKVLKDRTPFPFPPSVPLG